MCYDANRRNALASGYGLMSLQFGEGLRALGNEVVYYDQDPDFKGELMLWMRPPHYVKYPEFKPENINVFFTMHETETLEGWKSDWAELLNKCNAVIVPTEWNKGVFEKLGVTKPIYVVPLGVDTKKFIGNRTWEFSILSVHEALGKDNSREDWKENITAYYETFYDQYNTEVSYTIKSWNIDRDGYRNFVDKLINDKQYDREKLPRIDILEIELVTQDMNQLYGKSWAFLKNSVKEGWCLPALEAIATGTRVISRQIGAMPYLNDNNTDFYTDIGTLKIELWENYRRWRKWKNTVNAWSWKTASKKLDGILKEIINV